MAAIGPEADIGRSLNVRFQEIKYRRIAVSCGKVKLPIKVGNQPS
jgi:hypothetical protein